MGSYYILVFVFETNTVLASWHVLHPWLSPMEDLLSEIHYIIVYYFTLYYVILYYTIYHVMYIIYLPLLSQEGLF